MDDIVERLRGSIPGDPDYVLGLISDAAAEIERLRAQVEWSSNRASEWKLETYQLNAEIELLDTALHLAAGLLSALEPYQHMHPDQVLQFLLKEEARRG